MKRLYPLLRRVIQDKRTYVLPLALALLVNAGVGLFVVLPLRARVLSAETRGAEARAASRVAERERTAALTTRAGKERAEAALKKFYGEVLPADFAAARRVLYLRIDQIARESNVQYRRHTVERRKEVDERLGNVRKLTESVVLEGTYENVRRFIHALETGPEFVVIDNVSLAMRNEAGAPLTLSVVLSTYYRTGAHGG